MTVTRKDVARLAGVSTATVSYVINNGPRPVSDETRRRVLWAIDQLGYQPNAIARSLITKRTNTIGFVIPDILNPVWAAIAQRFEGALQAAGYSLILCNSDESPVHEEEYLQILLGRQVDGIALAPTGENRQFLFSLVESGKHLVLLDRQLEGMKTDCVVIDNEEGAYRAIRHLIELNHSRIGLINLSSSLTPGQKRLEGYKRALLEAGLKIDPALIREGSFKAQEGEALAESLLDNNSRPTALFVSSNRLMRGVLSVIKKRKLRLPEDLALCAFDDVGHYANRTPSITAVYHSLDEFANEAVRLLIERINGEYTDEPRQVRIPCHLKIRESTVGISELQNGMTDLR